MDHRVKKGVQIEFSISKVCTDYKFECFIMHVQAHVHVCTK